MRKRKKERKGERDCEKKIQRNNKKEAERILDRERMNDKRMSESLSMKKGERMRK